MAGDCLVMEIEGFSHGYDHASRALLSSNLRVFCPMYLGGLLLEFPSVSFSG